MRAKIVTFPVRGKIWCFSRSIDPSMAAAQSPNARSTLKEHLRKRMNEAWSKLEKAPQGTLKHKIHGLGLKLLSRVKPSEIFFKSIPKETNGVDIIYPSRLMVCTLSIDTMDRQIHIIVKRFESTTCPSKTSPYCIKGISAVIHRNYFYGSAILLPLSSVLTVLPLPNIVFYWVLFRTYSHWRASQGSQKLLHLMSDASCRLTGDSDECIEKSATPPWVFEPNDELQKLLQQLNDGDKGLSESAISKICQKFYLNSVDVEKYRDSI